MIKTRIITDNPDFFLGLAVTSEVKEVVLQTDQHAVVVPLNKEKTIEVSLKAGSDAVFPAFTTCRDKFGFKASEEVIA